MSSPGGAASTLSLGAFVFDGPATQVFENLRRVSRNGQARVLAIALDDVSDTWPLLSSGASDVLAWTDAVDVADRAAERFRRWHEVEELASSTYVKENLVGESPAWRNTLREFVKVAHFTDTQIVPEALS